MRSVVWHDRDVHIACVFWPINARLTAWHACHSDALHFHGHKCQLVDFFPNPELIRRPAWTLFLSRPYSTWFPGVCSFPAHLKRDFWDSLPFTAHMGRLGWTSLAFLPYVVRFLKVSPSSSHKWRGSYTFFFSHRWCMVSEFFFLFSRMTGVLSELPPILRTHILVYRDIWHGLKSPLTHLHWLARLLSYTRTHSHKRFRNFEEYAMTFNNRPRR